jgi:hypothetical protein
MSLNNYSLLFLPLFISQLFFFAPLRAKRDKNIINGLIFAFWPMELFFEYLPHEKFEISFRSTGSV